VTLAGPQTFSLDNAQRKGFIVFHSPVADPDPRPARLGSMVVSLT
jgi:hypothetical protein